MYVCMYIYIERERERERNKEKLTERHMKTKVYFQI